MKILSRALFLLFLLICILIAVSNAQRVELTVWPLPYSVAAPLYLVIVCVLLLGVLAGLGLGWWAARHHRRRARDHGKQAARLDREVERLRGTLAATAAASQTPDVPASRDQRAIERQSALVAPDLIPPPGGRLPS